MSASSSTGLVTQLDRDGFCLVPGVLGQTTIDLLTELAEQKLGGTDDDHFRRFAHHGSLIPITFDDERLATVLTSPEIRTAFCRLGFTDPRWISGYVIAKPPHSPGLWWHQDWWAWGHPYSYRRQATQIFCMIYLQSTSRKNGCLRALPGSHLNRHPLHDALPEPHTLHIEAEGEDSLSHRVVTGESEIQADPGDLVIGDVRVLHATHPNTTDSWRTAVDLLFVPHFNSLPNEFQAHYVNQFCLPPVGWWTDPSHPLIGSPLSEILPVFQGPDRERMMEYCRQPQWPATQ